MGKLKQSSVGGSPYHTWHFTAGTWTAHIHVIYCWARKMDMYMGWKFSDDEKKSTDKDRQDRLEQNRSTGRKRQHSLKKYEAMQISAKKARGTCALISYCKAQKKPKKKWKPCWPKCEEANGLSVYLVFLCPGEKTTQWLGFSPTFSSIFMFMWKSCTVFSIGHSGIFL